MVACIKKGGILWLKKEILKDGIGVGLSIILMVILLIIVGLITLGAIISSSIPISTGTLPETTQINNEKETEYSKYKTTYQWECTKDMRHEQIDEYQILAVEDDGYNGIVLESGKYKISYTYKDYTSTFGISTTNKYNRFYFVYITNELGTIQDIMDEKINHSHWLTFCPAVHNEEIVELEKGQYVYIEHTPIKEAGDGTIKLEKIQ